MSACSGPIYYPKSPLLFIFLLLLCPSEQSQQAGPYQEKKTPFQLHVDKELIYVPFCTWKEARVCVHVCAHARLWLCVGASVCAVIL